MNKYRNKIIKTQDGKFDSKYEYEEWCRLKLLEKSKIISDLKRQVSFELIPSVNTKQGTLKKISYIADFVYTENNKLYAVDTKGFETDTYKIKKRLFIIRYSDKYIFVERKKNKKEKIY